jgi:hypothetical protein
MTASKEVLTDLHAALADALSARIKDGTATAADLSVAVKFLKDNGIDAIAKGGSPLARLRDSLPFPDADGVESEYQH